METFGVARVATPFTDSTLGGTPLFFSLVAQATMLVFCMLHVSV